MNFTINDIKALENPSGAVHLVRFTISFSDPDLGPVVDYGGWLLNAKGSVKPPSVYTQRGTRLAIITAADWFLEALEKEWRTHPDLKGYWELLQPSLARRMETDFGLKTKVELSLRGVTDAI